MKLFKLYFLCYLNSPLRKSRGNLDSIPPSEVVQSSKSCKTKKPPRETPTHSSESLDEFSACADSRNIPYLFTELPQGLLSWILVDLFFPWEAHRGQGQDSLRSFETRDLGYIGNPIVFSHSSFTVEKRAKSSRSSLPKRGDTQHLTGVTWPLGGFSYTLEDKRIQVNNTLPVLKNTFIFSPPNQISPPDPPSPNS